MDINKYTLYNVDNRLYKIKSTVYILHCTMYKLEYQLYNVKSTMWILQCTK